MDADRFSKRRKELGYTMTYVAEKVGVNSTTIARWEKGDIANMRRDKINAYAQVLRVSPLWVMGIETKSTADSFFADVRALEEKYFDPSVELAAHSELDSVMACMLIMMREMPTMSPQAAKATVEYMVYLKNKED